MLEFIWSEGKGDFGKEEGRGEEVDVELVEGLIIDDSCVSIGQGSVDKLWD